MNMEFSVVDIQDENPATEICVQACVGLLNREKANIYVIKDGQKDNMWLDELNLRSYSSTTTTQSLISKTMQKFRKVLLYSYDSQQALLPNILTLAAVSDSIPMEESQLSQIQSSLNKEKDTSDVEVVDARSVFEKHNTPIAATRLMYEAHGNCTSGIAMLNPGYDTWDCPTPWNPPLSKRMETSMIDLVFKTKLFALFLVNGGIPLTKAHRLLNHIARSNDWVSSTPLKVYGYADHWHVFGGYYFESHTRVSSCRNMGAIPTLGTTNLSFFSSLKAHPASEPKPYVQNPVEEVTYDPSHTYVAFVVGDGDNIQFMMSTRADWMKERLECCQELANTESMPSKRASLTWTISPHLATLAPTVMNWYYDKAKESGCDYFMLPPSGHLYAYPTSLATSVQDAFITATESDATLLQTSSTIHWEWFTSWWRAERTVIPKYGIKGVIQGVFPSNVPFPFPTFTWWNWPSWKKKNIRFYKVLQPFRSTNPSSKPVVLFRPREWRGVHGSANDYYHKSPQDMAADIANYPPGTVAYIYMSSDDGLRLKTSFMKLCSTLPDRVHLVSTDAATRLALQAHTANEKKR